MLDKKSNPCSFKTKEVEPKGDLDKSGGGLDSGANESLGAIGEFDSDFNGDFFFSLSDQKFKFKKNILGLIYESNNKKRVLLGLQIKELPNDQNKSMFSNASEEASKPGEYKTIGWNFFALNNKDGTIKIGRHTMPTFIPPMLAPPYNEDKCDIFEAELDFSIDIIDFDKDDDDHKKKKKDDGKVKEKDKKK